MNCSNNTIRMLAPVVSTHALGLALAASAFPAFAEGFLEDAKASLTARNFYINRNFTNPAYSQGKAEEWTQSFILDAKSGFTQGTVGFGVDVLGLYALKLDGGRGTTNTHLLPVHDDGKGPKEPVPLGDVLSEKYLAVIKQSSKGPQWDKGDPAVGKVLQFNVKAYTGLDLAIDPAAYEPAKPGKAEGLVMIPLKLHRDNAADKALLARARHRTFIFGRSDGTDEAPWTVKTDGGFGFHMDPRRLNASAQLASGPTDAGTAGFGTLEVWNIKAGGKGWSHPVHVHFEEGIILSRGGKAPPEWEKWARKDVYRIGSENDGLDSVEMAINFREFAGTYMEHCHNTQHEDNSMLLRWDIEKPGQFQLMPTPLPSWDGVRYVNSAALPTFRNGDGVGPQVQVTK